MLIWGFCACLVGWRVYPDTDLTRQMSNTTLGPMWNESSEKNFLESAIFVVRCAAHAFKIKTRFEYFLTFNLCSWCGTTFI